MGSCNHCGERTRDGVTRPLSNGRIECVCGLCKLREEFELIEMQERYQLPPKPDPPKKKRNRITRDDPRIRLIQEMYCDKKMRVSDIGHKFKISNMTVYNYLKRAR